MHILRRLARPVTYLMVSAFLLMILPLPTAQAALVGTDTVLDSISGDTARNHVRGILDREDVRAQLLARGVDPSAVQARIDALTDQEAQRLAAHMEELPAGGSAVGVLVLIFLVLLFTDLMGWTDVFPFTKKGSARR